MCYSIPWGALYYTGSCSSFAPAIFDDRLERMIFLKQYPITVIAEILQFSKYAFKLSPARILLRRKRSTREDETALKFYLVVT